MCVHAGNLSSCLLDCSGLDSRLPHPSAELSDRLRISTCHHPGCQAACNCRGEPKWSIIIGTSDDSATCSGSKYVARKRGPWSTWCRPMHIWCTTGNASNSLRAAATASLSPGLQHRLTRFHDAAADLKEGKTARPNARRSATSKRQPRLHQRRSRVVVVVLTISAGYAWRWRELAASKIRLMANSNDISQPPQTFSADLCVGNCSRAAKPCYKSFLCFVRCKTRQAGARRPFAKRTLKTYTSYCTAGPLSIKQGRRLPVF